MLSKSFSLISFLGFRIFLFALKRQNSWSIIIISVLVNLIATRRGRFGHQILNIYVLKQNMFSNLFNFYAWYFTFDFWQFLPKRKDEREGFGGVKTNPSKSNLQLTFFPKHPTVWPEPIWIKVKKSWLLLPHHQSTYPRGPESSFTMFTFRRIFTK